MRLKIFEIVQSNGFDLMILFTIIKSSITLAMDGPLVNPDSSLNNTIKSIDMLTKLIFIFEASLKIVAYGFLFNDR